MSAAEDLSLSHSHEPRLPKATPELRAREALHRELYTRLIEMAKMGDGWDGRGSKAPGVDVLFKAAELGVMIIGSTFPIPNTLNLGASADGLALFALYGAGGREADLWVEDGGGEFHYVTSHGATESEGKMPIANYMRFAAWLSGKTKEP